MSYLLFFIIPVFIFILRSQQFQQPDIEKLSFYECCFNAWSDARSKFEVRFYLLENCIIYYEGPNVKGYIYNLNIHLSFMFYLFSEYWFLNHLITLFKVSLFTPPVVFISYKIIGIEASIESTRLLLLILFFWVYYFRTSFLDSVLFYLKKN